MKAFALVHFPREQRGAFFGFHHIPFSNGVNLFAQDIFLQKLGRANG